MKSKSDKVQLSRALSVTLLDPAGELPPPAEMETRLRDAVAAIGVKDLNCSEKEWLGCLESNIRQIRGGYMAIKSNTYNEGGSDMRVISTS